VTNTAVAVRLPDTWFTDTVLPSECNDSVVLTHLENALPAAVIDISSSKAIGITVFAVIVYTALFIVTVTEPVPFRFAVNVNDPVTNTAVAVRLPVAVVVTVLPSERRSSVALTHLENVLPVSIAVIAIESPEAIGISVSVVIVYTALFIVTTTEPDPSMFAESV